MKDPSVAFFKDAVEPNYAHPLYDGLEGQTLKHELGYEDQEQRFGITEKQRSQSKSKLRWERGHDSLFNNGQNVAGTRNTMSQ